MQISKINGEAFFKDVIKYIESMVPIQKLVLTYIEDNENEDTKFQNLIDYISQTQIFDDKNKIKSFFYLIMNIFNHHHRNNYFLTKIDKITSKYKNELLKHFPLNDIKKCFKRNKRFLLSILTDMSNDNTLDSSLIKELHYSNDENENQEIFEKKIRNGENDNLLCEIIRQDEVDQFVIWINQRNISINCQISPSQFESHLYLILNQPLLIEYATFFGSIQIFRHLQFSDSKLNEILWLDAIHGRNPEIIHILEEIHLKPPEESYITCMKEAIKCHHNEILEYFEDNYKSDLNDQILLQAGFEAYNFEIIYRQLQVDNIVIDYNLINSLANSDYFYFLNFLIDLKIIDTHQFSDISNNFFVFLFE